MRLFDAEWELPKPEAPKKLIPKARTPLKSRVDWSPITPVQGKQTFGVRYFSRRMGMNIEYAIGRDPSKMEDSWMELKAPPKGAELQMGKDPETKKWVCRLLIYGVDSNHYVLGKLNELNKRESD